MVFQRHLKLSILFVFVAILGAQTNSAYAVECELEGIEADELLPPMVRQGKMTAEQIMALVDPEIRECEIEKFKLVQKKKPSSLTKKAKAILSYIEAAGSEAASEEELSQIERDYTVAKAYLDVTVGTKIHDKAENYARSMERLEKAALSNSASESKLMGEHQKVAESYKNLADSYFDNIKGHIKGNPELLKIAENYKNAANEYHATIKAAGKPEEISKAHEDLVSAHAKLIEALGNSRKTSHGKAPGSASSVSSEENSDDSNSGHGKHNRKKNGKKVTFADDLPSDQEQGELEKLKNLVKQYEAELAKLKKQKASPEQFANLDKNYKSLLDRLSQKGSPLLKWAAAMGAGALLTKMALAGKVAAAGTAGAAGAASGPAAAASGMGFGPAALGGAAGMAALYGMYKAYQFGKWMAGGSKNNPAAKKENEELNKLNQILQDLTAKIAALEQNRPNDFAAEIERLKREAEAKINQLRNGNRNSRVLDWAAGAGVGALLMGYAGKSAMASGPAMAASGMGLGSAALGGAAGMAALYGMYKAYQYGKGLGGGNQGQPVNGIPNNRGMWEKAKELFNQGKTTAGEYLQSLRTMENAGISIPGFNPFSGITDSKKISELMQEAQKFGKEYVGYAKDSAPLYDKERGQKPLLAKATEDGSSRGLKDVKDFKAHPVDNETLKGIHHSLGKQNNTMEGVENLGKILPASNSNHHDTDFTNELSEIKRIRKDFEESKNLLRREVLEKACSTQNMHLLSGIRFYKVMQSLLKTTADDFELIAKEFEKADHTKKGELLGKLQEKEKNYEIFRQKLADNIIKIDQGYKELSNPQACVDQSILKKTTSLANIFYDSVCKALLFVEGTEKETSKVEDVADVLKKAASELQNTKSALNDCLDHFKTIFSKPYLASKNKEKDLLTQINHGQLIDQFKKFISENKESLVAFSSGPHKHCSDSDYWVSAKSLGTRYEAQLVCEQGIVYLVPKKFKFENGENKDMIPVSSDSHYGIPLNGNHKDCKIMPFPSVFLNPEL